jgi:hypothetical protein
MAFAGAGSTRSYIFYLRAPVSPRPGCNACMQGDNGGNGCTGETEKRRRTELSRGRGNVFLPLSGCHRMSSSRAHTVSFSNAYRNRPARALLFIGHAGRCTLQRHHSPDHRRRYRGPSTSWTGAAGIRLLALPSLRTVRVPSAMRR